MEKSEQFELLINCFEKKYDILVAFAQYLLKLKIVGNYTPKGQEAEDIVQNAIKGCLLGRRNWNPQKVPDPLKFLMGVIKSNVSHLTDSSDVKKRYIPGQFDDNDRFWEDIIDSQPSVQVCLEAQELWDKLLRSADGDDEMETVMLHLMEGYKRKDIIKETGLSDRQFDNILKKIRRKVNEIVVTIEA